MPFDPQSFLAQGQPAAAPVPADQTQVNQFDPKDFLNQSAIQLHDEQQAKYGTPGQQILAGLESAAGGATLNLSRLAEVKSGLTTPEAMKGREEANPITSGVGEFGGGAAMLLGTGGLGGLAEGAGVAGKIAATAAEGGLFGAGNVVKDLALGDPNLNAQKIAAHIGTGVALGAGFGALSQGVKLVLPKAAETLTSSLDNLKGATLGTEAAPSALAKAAAIPGSILSGDTQEGWLQKLMATAYGKNQNSVIKEAAGNLTKIYDSANEVASSLEPIEAEPSLIKGPIKNFPPAPGTPLFAEGAEAVPQVDLAAAHDEALAPFEKEFVVDGKVDPDRIKAAIGGSLGGNQQGKLDILNNFVKSAESLAKGAQNTAGLEQSGNAVSDTILQLAKQHKQLAELAEALRPTAKGSSTFGVLKDVGAIAALKGIGLSNPVVTGLIGALETAKSLGNPIELGTSIANSLEKLSAITKMTEAVNGKIASSAKSIFSVNPDTVTSPLSGALSASGKSYDKKIDRINELTSDPQKFFDHLTESTVAMHDAAPNISQGLTKTMTNAVQFLKTKVPVPTSQKALDPEWEPSRMQKEKFERYYRAVNDPVACLKDIKNGTLSNESMESLQAVHPELLQEMRQKVLENINLAKAKKLPYGIKIAISKFLGEPLDSQMLPQVIAANQIALNAPEQGQNAAPRQGGRKQPSLGGLKQLNLAARTATQTQDVATDED